jgi:hypothetical protein
MAAVCPDHMNRETGLKGQLSPIGSPDNEQMLGTIPVHAATIHGIEPIGASHPKPTIYEGRAVRKRIPTRPDMAAAMPKCMITMPPIPIRARRKGDSTNVPGITPHSRIIVPTPIAADAQSRLAMKLLSVLLKGGAEREARYISKYVRIVCGRIQSSPPTLSFATPLDKTKFIATPSETACAYASGSNIAHALYNKGNSPWRFVTDDSMRW